MRVGVGALVAVMVATAAGCGGDNNNSIGNNAKKSPGAAGVVLTVLNYGRTASAKEVCPFLSKGFVDRITNGHPSKCATTGDRVLCPCISETLSVSSVSVNGDKATAVASRPNGKTVKLALVKEGSDWKIDSLERQA
jgi:hypothetical protein